MNIFIGVLFVVILLFLKHFYKRKSHPPGPLGLPIVGVFPYYIIKVVFSKFITNVSENEYFKQMRQKYGNIWSIESCGQRSITLASYDIVHEALVDNGIVFAGCAQNLLVDLYGNKCGILFVDGEIWKRNRQSALKALRSFGMGTSTMERLICEQADNLPNSLKKRCGSVIDPSKELVRTVSDVINIVNFCESNEKNDQKFEEYILSQENFGNSNVKNIIFIWPWFFLSKLGRFLFPKVEEYVNGIDTNRRLVAEKCMSRLKVFNETSDLKCVFDYIWNNEDLNEDLNDKTYDFKVKNIIQIMTDLQNGGTDTTYNILKFSCLMLGRHPDVQEDLRRELHNLVEDSTQIILNLKNKCPKLLSFIDEVQRFCILVPKIGHRVMKKRIFRGFELNPDDIIFFDLYSIMFDENNFENPQIFNPYRFLDDTRTEYVSSQFVIPFGIGKRACLGENLANMEIFLILSRIIYEFQISLSNETEKNFEKILEGNSGIVHTCLDYELVFYSQYKS